MDNIRNHVITLKYEISFLKDYVYAIRNYLDSKKSENVVTEEINLIKCKELQLDVTRTKLEEIKQIVRRISLFEITSNQGNDYLKSFDNELRSAIEEFIAY